MPKASIIIRPWTHNDQEGLLELRNIESAADDLAHPDFFEWQYKLNPAGEAIIGCAFEPGGRIIANYSAIPVPLLVNGEPVAASFSINALTHPEYRRLGLLGKTAKCVFEVQSKRNIPLTLTFPTLYAYKSQMKLGFQELGFPELLVRIHDPVSVLTEKAVPGRLAGIARLATPALRLFQRKLEKRTSIEEIHAVNGLCTGNLLENAKVVVNADAKWLNWRYKMNPRRKYRIFAVKQFGEIEGLVVHRVFDCPPRKRGVIMELMLSSSAGSDIVESLLWQACKLSEEAGCSLTMCLMSPGARKAKQVKQFGFWNVPMRLRSRGMHTGVIIWRKNIPYERTFKIEDVDVSFGMLDTL